MAIQGSRGKVRQFTDFTGLIAATTVADAAPIIIEGGFSVVAISGNTDVAAVTTETSGVWSFNGAGAAGDGAAVAAGRFQPSLNGTSIIEARWMSSVVTDCRLFVGFQETFAVAEPVVPFTLSGTTLTVNAAGEAVGFYFDAEATTDDIRFMAGSNSAASTTAALDYALGGQTTLGSLGVRANATVTASKWVVLRVELDSDGTARGYVGDETMGNSTGMTHIATLRAGDLSTTAIYTPTVTMTCHSTGDPLHQLDYVLVESNRDWTA